MKRGYFTISILLAALITGGAMAQDQPNELRQRAAKLQKDGNFKEAFEIYRQLLDKAKGATDPQSSRDLSAAKDCLQR
ncbi:MAG: hypothetical protein ACPH9O_06405, partial [Akkermansiaceae bacterium]